MIVRAIGPSLPVPGALADPILDLYNSAGQLLVSNDNNWMDAPNRQDIIDSTVPPTNNLESAAIALELNPGNYTAIVHGANNGSGVAAWSRPIRDLASGANPTLANISTRGLVQTGGHRRDRRLYHAGHQRPECPHSRDRVLRCRSQCESWPTIFILWSYMIGNGVLGASNDNWKDTRQHPEIEVSQPGVAAPPTDDAESAIVGHPSLRRRTLRDRAREEQRHRCCPGGDLPAKSIGPIS